jgi:hypothetical protein
MDAPLKTRLQPSDFTTDRYSGIVNYPHLKKSDVAAFRGSLGLLPEKSGAAKKVASPGKKYPNTSV